MKFLFILSGLMIGLFFVSETRAQTPVVFAKGASSKTMTVTVPAGGSRSFLIAVGRNQVINVDAPADVSVNLLNGADGVDYWQDGEGYLSVLTGRKKTYVFTVTNSGRRARSFSMRVAVTDNRGDYRGGTD